MSKTATECAREIRAAYKRRGWTSRMISVRSEYFSMGSAIRVEVKDPSIPILEAQRIAEGSERIHRCEITGEILGGGNRYVTVSTSRECQEILARRHVQALTEALARLGEDRSRIEPIEGAEPLGVNRENGSTAKLWSDRCEVQFYPGNEAGIMDGAYHVARILERLKEESEPEQPEPDSVVSAPADTPKLPENGDRPTMTLNEEKGGIWVVLWLDDEDEPRYTLHNQAEEACDQAERTGGEWGSLHDLLSDKDVARAFLGVEGGAS